MLSARGKEDLMNKGIETNLIFIVADLYYAGTMSGKEDLMNKGIETWQTGDRHPGDWHPGWERRPDE